MSKKISGVLIIYFSYSIRDLVTRQLMKTMMKTFWHQSLASLSSCLNVS